jgi:hypothetical protein
MSVVLVHKVGFFVFRMRRVEPSQHIIRHGRHSGHRMHHQDFCYL